MSHVRCHVSGVICHLSGVMCHNIYFLQRVGASRRRVFYQQGLPHLVLKPASSRVLNPHFLWSLQYTYCCTLHAMYCIAVKFTAVQCSALYCTLVTSTELSFRNNAGFGGVMRDEGEMVQEMTGISSYTNETHTF